MFKILKANIVDFYFFLLDFIFPRGLLEEEIEDLNMVSLCQKASPASLIEEKNIRAFFDYRDPFVKNLIWLLKYKRNAKVTKLFGEILADNILEDISESRVLSGISNFLITPIPMHKKSLRERGYNQVEMLCEEI